MLYHANFPGVRSIKSILSYPIITLSSVVVKTHLLFGQILAFSHPSPLPAADVAQELHRVPLMEEVLMEKGSLK